MSRYLNSEQQERFDRIINDFYNQKTSDQEGLTVKVGTTIVYRAGVENKPDIDRIKPFELEKLVAAVNFTESAKGTVEIALYTPAIEEVFRYENGNKSSINKQRANERTKELEEPLQAQLLNQQPTTQLVEEQPENDPTQLPTLEGENQKTNNQINLDKDFGYLSTDYYLRDASPIFGEWAKQFTPNGIYLMSQMGLDWQYFADKYSQQKAASQPVLEGTPERMQLPPGQEQPAIDISAETIAQTDPTISNQQLVETLALLQQQIADIQRQVEEMRQQQAERLELVQPKDNRLAKWMDGIKQNFSNTVQEIGEAVRGGIDYLKDTTRELVGAGLEATTKLAVDLVGDRQLDGSKLLAAGNIEYRLQGQELSAVPQPQQQQDWANLSLQERLTAIRTQYGITQPSPGEKQQHQFKERSR
ncbi:hypothetical protein [Iningainema tapete]|uniref:Uncharacterized protein n=1 Tax=Iningainema tapete BLCC-T55 TaxID=2748662 RepID=A0A8J6XAB0_9CYAN|nr:hypothetical protein [Iningainema tapete]MBD2770634.1 hypothetical protein [Iningainema tapete BLCC-T55]